MNHFSLIVTCYNLEKFIGECLESLRDQNYPKELYEVIVADDGSADASPDLIRKFEKENGFRVLAGPNQGLEKACNGAIRAAANEWIIRVDGDDFLDREYLKTVDAAMQSFPGFDFYYCKDYYEFYSETNKTLKKIPDFSPEEIFQRGDFFATGTAYRKKDLEAVGLLPEARKNCGLENYAVTLALLARGKKGMAVPKAIFYYRRHEANMSTLRRSQIINFGHELLAGYGRLFVTNEYHPYGLKLEAGSFHEKK